MLYFEYLTGPFSGQGFTVADNNNVTIGRDFSADITINDRTISREHLIIYWESNKPYVKDLESRNGSFLNGKKLGDEELRDGDTLLIARSIELKAHIGDDFEIPKRSRVDSIISYDINKGLYVNIDEGESQEALRDLNAFYQIGTLITIENNSRSLLKNIGNVVSDILQPDRTVIILRDIDTDELERITVISNLEDSYVLPISNTIVMRSLKQGISIISEDALVDDRFEEGASILTSGIRSVMCAPLKSMDDILGVVYVDSVKMAKAFDQRDLMLLTAIGMQVGVAIARARLYERNQDFLLQTVRALVATIEIKDTYTKGHSERVTDYSIGIGEELGLSHLEMIDLRIAALLHDIGKIGISEEILNKPGRLSDKEFEKIKMHPVDGAEILKNLKGKEKIYKAIRHHHERYDGNGYPDGLKYNEIPYLARIISIADAFDAMTSTRPYRKPLTELEAKEEIQRCSATQFDPEITAAFLDYLAKGKSVKRISIIQSMFDVDDDRTQIDTI